MFDAIIGCPVQTPTPLWVYFGFVLVLTTWAVVVRRREPIVRRPALGALAVLGWIGCIAYLLLHRRIAPDDAWTALLQTASFTTGCVYLEIVLSPAREPIPAATIVHER
jgi:hypothetical protein